MMPVRPASERTPPADARLTVQPVCSPEPATVATCTVMAPVSAVKAGASACTTWSMPESGGAPDPAAAAAAIAAEVDAT